ncbi:MAG: hypothetical protein CM1200mP9_07350 [Gammaproteobacteria bacterium]|nr:MAG: hypothetical protein CM1200mP9_07350 [Gammaproteobacteria bacterium]
MRPYEEHPTESHVHYGFGRRRGATVGVTADTPEPQAQKTKTGSEVEEATSMSRKDTELEKKRFMKEQVAPNGCDSDTGKNRPLSRVPVETHPGHALLMSGCPRVTTLPQATDTR